MMHPGEIVCTLAPCGRNSRNSEGSFAFLPDGRVRFLYSRFEDDTGSDDANCDIAEIVSSDGGKTWSEPRVRFRAADCGADNLMSVSLLRMGNGELGLFYLVKEDWRSRYVLRRSADGGETWSAPADCIGDPGYHVVNNDRVVRLSSGRLVIPAAVHTPRSMGKTGARDVCPDAFDVFYLSDDDGASWRQSRTAAAFFSPYNPAGLQEPGAVELPGGLLWGYARTSLGRQYEFFSPDGGESWTPAQPSQFTSPCSPMHIRRSPSGARLLAVWNPAPSYPTRGVPWGHDRNPLVYALSDGGMAFGEPVVLEDTPGHGYCYPAIGFADEHTVLLAYCAGGDEDGGCLNRTVIRRIEI